MTQPGYREKIYPKYTSQKMTDFIDLSDDEYRRWGRTTGKYIEGWLPQNKDAKCLDIACGAGHALHLLKSAGYRNFAGIDISPEQVATSKKVWLEVYEANALQFLLQHKDTYDLIIGFDIVEHFTKDELFDFLDGIHAALRPGGRVILQTPNADSPFGLMHRYNDLTHELCFNKHSLNHLLNITGFGEFSARECGPVVYGLKSLIRSIAWRAIRGGIKLWNLIETGHVGSDVFTRVFLVSAIKKNVKRDEN